MSLINKGIDAFNYLAIAFFIEILGRYNRQYYIEIFIIDKNHQITRLEKEFSRPNGLFSDDKDFIYLGTSEGIFKINPGIGTSELIFKETGSIDGLKRFGDNGFIFSDWTGNVYVVDKDGKKEKILDTTPEKINAADFEYIPELNLIVIPTFLHNSLMAYEVK